MPINAAENPGTTVNTAIPGAVYLATTTNTNGAPTTTGLFQIGAASATNTLVTGDYITVYMRGGAPSAVFRFNIGCNGNLVTGTDITLGATNGFGGMAIFGCKADNTIRSFTAQLSASTLTA